MNELCLNSFLSSNLNVAEKEILSIKESCFIREYEKDQFLLRNNELCQHTFFVEKGLLRQYSIDPKGKEHILQFVPESWFVTD